MFHTVERLERCAIRHGLHHNLMTLYHISIEAMQRLAIGHHDIIGDIHDIINRTQTDCCQLILQPIGTFLYLTVSDADTGIALTSLLVLNHHLNRQIMVVNLEL